jgi:methyltransferase (TIGR00027 family)
VARTRFIDDVVSARADTASQMVILGAGFDTRAHRLAAAGALTTFEVDHPATQARKRAVLERLGLPEARVTYVAVDFEHDRLDERLRAAAFDASRPTIFVWEGVTNYLSPTAVDATLATIRDLAASGSLVVFTYVHAGVIDGTVHFDEAARWLHNVERAGEPWIFGLRPDEVGEFLRVRGYTLESDASTEELGDRWFPARGRSERGSALYHVVVATIP